MERCGAYERSRKTRNSNGAGIDLFASVQNAQSIFTGYLKTANFLSSGY
jgi:hypothetical protein